MVEKRQTIEIALRTISNMGFFDTEQGVNEYIKLAEGYDGAELIKILQKVLPEKSTVLELGMGPGKDLDILSKFFKATGSDSSQVFLDRYKQENPEADLLKLDAVTIPTDRTFDCIYSNKVLHHLTRKELKESFQRQKRGAKFQWNRISFLLERRQG